MPQYRPLVNEAQTEVWGDIPFPPRSIVEVSRLNQVALPTLWRLVIGRF